MIDSIQQIILNLNKNNKYNKELYIIKIQRKINMRDHFIDVKNQTPRQRMERIKRNRQIRKQKLYGTVVKVQQSETNQINTNQQKGYIQKLKNRQAAQKSRQQKKLYVTQLQQQLKRLKFKMSNCPTCRNQLYISQTEHTHQYTIQTNSRQTHQTSSYQEQNQSQYIRMSSTEENSSIGIYLFVFMIIIGIFCVGTRVDGSEAGVPFKRDLMQNFQQSINSDLLEKQLPVQTNLPPVLYKYQQNMNPTYSTHHQVNVDPQLYQNGLLSMDQIKSPSAISDQKYIEKIITSFQNYKLSEYDDKNLRSKVGLIDANKSFLFCGRPKIYKTASAQDGIITTFLDIFVKGAEIINILPQSEQTTSSLGSFQLDGLYKITASVQEIEQIRNPNFVY